MVIYAGLQGVSPKGMKMTPEQEQNWRRLFADIMGEYIMPQDEMLAIKDLRRLLADIIGEYALIIPQDELLAIIDSMQSLIDSHQI